MAIWAEKHAPYTRFLPRPARKESNVPKIKSTLEVTVLIYINTYILVLYLILEKCVKISRGILKPIKTFHENNFLFNI